MAVDLKAKWQSLKSSFEKVGCSKHKHICKCWTH